MEFSLVIPFVAVFLMGVLEVSLALNASLAVTRASQHGAHMAASAGNNRSSDCLVLEGIERDLGVPNTPGRISEVVIERTAMAGDTSYAQQIWSRSGSTTCTLLGGQTIELPYTLTNNGYPESQRCVVLQGCPLLTPPRSTVDNIGVTVRYTHDWLTPLNGVLGLIAPGASSAGSPAGWDFEQRNIFRMEPVL